MSTTHEEPHEDIHHFTPATRTWAIFLVSVLALFLEMMLIRWIGTEIRIFAYLQNTILVVCFLGLGIGCFTSRQPIVLRRALVPLAVLVLVLAVPISRAWLGRIGSWLSVLGDLAIWFSATGTNLWLRVLLATLALVMTIVLLTFVVDIFVPFGRLLGRLIDDHPNTILAYSVNIAGSLVGTNIFVLVSLLYQPPVTWFAIVAVLILFLLNRGIRDCKLNLALLIATVALAWLAGQVPDSLRVVWSPYQKLVVIESDRASEEVGQYRVLVNNTGYQMMDDLSPAHTTSSPEWYWPKMSGLSQYDIPLLLHPNPKTYLIVGAGAGNDAAGGLRHAVQQITATEIDPAIISIGRDYHPEKPYESPSVQLVNDDARSFFARTKDKFDVIAFSLLDSHTTTAMTNARLDHYVYTKESITQAKTLLPPGGILVLSFEAEKPYIADRMARTLRDVFGEEPIAFRIPATGYGYGGIMFISGDLATARQQIQDHDTLAALIDRSQQVYPLALSYTTRVATDDWPYIYLEKPRIPLLYFVLAGLMLGLLIRSYRRWGASGLVGRWGRSSWHFFFLGAAFLLLEVQNISKASVVLGNTWQVNAVIVSSVLVMALLANLLAHRFPRLPLSPVYGALVGTCLALYFVDLAHFALLPYPMKALLVGVLTTTPTLFSGIVFVRSFAGVVGKDAALGANMTGSIVGALLQSVTFVTGIKSLLLIVAAFYALSALTKPRAAKQRSNTASSA